jgi:hypothetical protein
MREQRTLIRISAELLGSVTHIDQLLRNFGAMQYRRAGTPIEALDRGEADLKRGSRLLNLAQASLP